MTSLKESGKGIGDFAQSLFEQESSNPQPAPRKAPVRGDVPDIESVHILQEDVNQVLSNSFGIGNTEEVSQEEPKKTLTEERERQLKEEIQIKINELKELLNELGVTAGTTTVGSLGPPNFAGASSYERKTKKRRSKGAKRTARVRRSR